MFTKVKTDKEIAAMRESGHMLATVLGLLRTKVTNGISTKELADIAAKELKSLGGKPAFLGYSGFPDVICISINEEVVHGIPSSKKIISSGDIVGLDFGVVIDGMITDSAVSVIADKSDEKRVNELVKTTEQAMFAGIDVIRNGVHVGDIAAAVQAILESKQFSIIRDYVGHGVGHELHEDPNIPNYGPKGSGPILKAGMTIAIEPMATLGSYEVFVADDEWAVVTKDNSWAAHFEHTVLITDNGAEILTQV